jgi:hypothetical protein
VQQGRDRVGCRAILAILVSGCLAWATDRAALLTEKPAGCLFTIAPATPSA